jgi:homoserine kinase
MEGHPDNVAPALLGGLVLGILPEESFTPESLIVKRLKPPNLTAVVVLPDFHLPTSEARAALPDRVSRRDAIFNVSRFGLLIHSLLTGDYRHLALGMTDRLHQPYRLPLIPGAEAALRAALESGALAAALSGAGPALIAFTDSNQDHIAEVMVSAFREAGLESRKWILNPTSSGVVFSGVVYSLDE